MFFFVLSFHKTAPAQRALAYGKTLQSLMTVCGVVPFPPARHIDRCQVYHKKPVRAFRTGLFLLINICILHGPLDLFTDYSMWIFGYPCMLIYYMSYNTYRTPIQYKIRAYYKKRIRHAQDHSYLSSHIWMATSLRIVNDNSYYFFSCIKFILYICYL